MPDWKKYVREHLAPLQLGPERELEIIDEMAQHLEAVYDDALNSGASEQEAYQQASAHIKDWRLLECELIRAKRATGAAWLNKRIVPEVRIESSNSAGGIFMGSLVQDLRYALRLLLKSKAFAVVAVFSLAVGIGANTAIFSLINAVMLRMLPVKDPQQLALFSLVRPDRTSYSFNYPLIERLAQNDRHFTGLIAASSVSKMRMSVSEPGAGAEIESVQQAQVSGNYFSVLGTGAVLGRVLTDEDDSASNPQPVAVISYDFWKRRFGLDPQVVGKRITLNEFPFTIVGVTPAGFFGFEVGRKPDLWWPIRAVPLVTPANQSLKQNTHWWLRVIGRLRAGANVTDAREELDGILKQQVAEIITEGPPQPERARVLNEMRLELEPGGTGWTTLRQQFKQPLLILMAVVGLVLLTACTNVASLLLARSAMRRKEFAIRLAVGAGRGRIIRQLVTESLMLAVIGGAAGLLIAQWGSRALLTYLPAQQTAGLELSPDIRVLGFALAISVLTGVLFGLAPAMQATRLDLVTSLKNQSGWSARSRLALNFGLKRVLVVTQVALSLFLLIGAGLFVRSLQNLKSVDTGFDRESLVQFGIEPGGRLDTARRVRLYKQVLERLETLPGTRSASLLIFPLLSGSDITNRIAAPGYVPQTAEDRVCHQLLVGPKFIETMGIPLLSGRDFTADDDRQPKPDTGDGKNSSQTVLPVAPVSAVINQSMARQFFPNEDPIGKRFTFDGGSAKDPTFEVIGVVKDAKYNTLREPAPKTFYSSYFQRPTNIDMMFQLRTLGSVFGLGASIQRTLRELSPALYVTGFQTMNDVVDESLTQERFIAQIAGFFSLFALLLASVGLYGVMSQSVARRTNEIGIRMALGAMRSDVIWMVLRDTMLLVVIGAAVGLGAALATMRLVSSFLFGLTPSDPTTMSLAVLVLIAVAAVAGYLPARRASRVDPMIALRCE